MSQFRQNLSDYIAKVLAGHIVILENEKKEQQLIQLVGKKKFNSDTFGKALKEASGVFNAKNHPEWQTKKDVIKWVEKGRLSADRHF